MRATAAAHGLDTGSIDVAGASMRGPPGGGGSGGGSAGGGRDVADDATGACAGASAVVDGTGAGAGGGAGDGAGAGAGAAGGAGAHEELRRSRNAFDRRIDRSMFAPPGPRGKGKPPL